jgi:NADH-quinone oxidoreductase subunit L
MLVAVSLGVAVAGLLLAWFVYVRRSLHARSPVLGRILGHQFYVEDAFNALVATPDRALARGAAVFDRSVLDGTVMGVARTVGRAGSALRGLQSGYLTQYAAFILLGALLILVYWVWR